MSLFRGASWGEKRAVMALLVIGAGLRIGLALLALGGPYDPYSRLRGDAAEYVALGLSLSRGEGFSARLQDALTNPGGLAASSSPAIPAGNRSPGYPLFLAAVFSMFGYSLHAVIWIQILLSVLTTLLIYLTARELSSRPVIALAFAVFYLPFAFDAVLLMSECLLTFSTAAALWLLVRPSREVEAGLLAGCVVLIKSVTLPFFVLPALIKGRWRIRFLVAFLAVLAPWGLRNYFHTGIPYVTPSYGGYQLLLLHNEANREFPVFERPGDQNEYYPGYWDLVIIANERAPRAADPVAQEYLKDRELAREAWRFIRADPGQAGRAVWRSVLNTWRVDIPPDHWRAGYEVPSQFRWLSNLVLYAGLLPFALWGAIQGLRHGPPGARWLVLFVLVFVAAHSVMSAQVRHRVSAMPAFFVLATCGVSRRPLAR